MRPVSDWKLKEDFRPRLVSHLPPASNLPRQLACWPREKNKKLDSACAKLTIKMLSRAEFGERGTWQPVAARVVRFPSFLSRFVPRNGEAPKLVLPLYSKHHLQSEAAVRPAQHCGQLLILDSLVVTALLERSATERRSRTRARSVSSVAWPPAFNLPSETNADSQNPYKRVVECSKHPGKFAFRRASPTETGL